MPQHDALDAAVSAYVTDSIEGFDPECGLGFVFCNEEPQCEEYKDGRAITDCRYCKEPLYVDPEQFPEDKLGEMIATKSLAHVYCFDATGTVEGLVQHATGIFPDKSSQDHPLWHDFVQMLGESDPDSLVEKLYDTLRHHPLCAQDNREGQTLVINLMDCHTAIDFVERFQSDQRMSKADIEYLAGKIEESKLVENLKFNKWIVDCYRGLGEEIFSNAVQPPKYDRLIPSLSKVDSVGAKASVLGAIHTYYFDEMYRSPIEQSADYTRHFRERFAELGDDRIVFNTFRFSFPWVQYISSNNVKRIEGWITDVVQALEPASSPAKKPAKKRKEKKEIDQVVLGALKKHHKYEEPAGPEKGPSIGLWEPIGVRQMAEKYKIEKMKVSRFFNDNFDGHEKYKDCVQKKGIGWRIHSIEGKLFARVDQVNLDPVLIDQGALIPGRIPDRNRKGFKGYH